MRKPKDIKIGCYTLEEILENISIRLKKIAKIGKLCI